MLITLQVIGVKEELLRVITCSGASKQVSEASDVCVCVCVRVRAFVCVCVCVWRVGVQCLRVFGGS